MRTRRVYFGGGLFDGAHLIGNAALAMALERVSGGGYEAVLPQDFDLDGATPREIRDRDLAELLGCDLALFQFDGSELDAGTVMEFAVAKFADLPSVILRTDFRGGGDQGAGGEPWNLMCSHWPRVRVVRVRSLEEYAALPAGDPVVRATGLIESVARRVSAALDAVAASAPALPEDCRGAVWRWLERMRGAE